MEIFEFKLVQNKENIQAAIEKIETEGEYAKDQTISLELANKLNELALILIGEEKFQESLKYLRKAESLSYQSNRHKAQTFNSIATFYKKQGKINTALKYIERSISLFPHGLAYLNLSSVLNVQGSFDKALEVSMHSIIFVQDEVIEEKTDKESISVENAELLAVAFYNLAVQLEYLKRTDEASSYYKKSVEFSSKYLPEGNSIRDILKQIYDKIISGVNIASEIKAKIEIPKPQLKKRVIIKVRSKSPINKSPVASVNKEPGNKKTVTNSTSYRKFIKSGISKAKFMENYSAALGKSEEIPEDTNKSTSRSIKPEKPPSEISFKNKIDPNKKKKPEADTDIKSSEEKKHKKVKKPKNSLKKSELEPENSSNPEKKSPKSLIIQVPEQKILPEDENNPGSLANSFEEIAENEEKLQKVFTKNGESLSPVSINSISNDKFAMGTEENFTDLIKIETDTEKVHLSSENNEEAKLGSEKSGQKLVENENHEQVEDAGELKEESGLVYEEKIGAEDEDEDGSEGKKEGNIEMKSSEMSLRFPLKLCKSYKDSLFDSFQLSKRVNSSQNCNAKYL